ncbi:MAG: DNA replication/repair protein RecF [Actinomycetaceae bacterium]|nr:DNA replication/repair protein RecF [Actinomycetaceae bacterium]MDY5273080.1 DNA replication/repair protein RecF [Arcanobacterium sp.]
MYISDFSLNDFRSYRDAVVHFDPGVIAFVGANGQGKTNLVEAVEYLSTFSSHRVAADTALVRQGASAAVVRARIHNASHSSVLELEIMAGKANRARLNRGAVRPAEIVGMVRTVVFAPEDLALVSADPSVRRRFLDDLMVQKFPRMRAVKADYEKVLKQRAALLKNAGKVRRRGGYFDDASLDVWDQQLAHLGARIIHVRSEIISQLREPVAQYYRDVSGQERAQARIDYDANVNHASSWQLPGLNELADHGSPPAAEMSVEASISEPNGASHVSQLAGNNSDGIHRGDGSEYSDASHFAQEKIAEREQWMSDSSAVEATLLQLLKDKRDREIELGVNLVGPHRDDLRLGLGSLPAKGYASHGESWSYALALKLACWQLLRSGAWGIWDEGDDPILILDDVFAELDVHRRNRLADLINEAQQVFITAAVGDDLPERLHATRYRVQAGTVSKIEANREADVSADGGEHHE